VGCNASKRRAHDGSQHRFDVSCLEQSSAIVDSTNCFAWSPFFHLHWNPIFFGVLCIPTNLGPCIQWRYCCSDLRIPHDDRIVLLVTELEFTKMRLPVAWWCSYDVSWRWRLH